MQPWQEDNITGHIKYMRDQAHKNNRDSWAMSDGIHAVLFVLHTFGHINGDQLRELSLLVCNWAIANDNNH